MTMEHSPESPGCAAVRFDLIRAASGEPVSPALSAHAAGCAACRAELNESRALLDSVQVALRPPAVDDGLVQRVLRRATPVARPSGAVRYYWRLAGALTAAAALGAALLPLRSIDLTVTSTDATPVAGAELTSDDAAAIAAAWRVLSWETPAEYSVTLIQQRADETAAQLQRESGAKSLLPWSAEEDWDMPHGSGESQA